MLSQKWLIIAGFASWLGQVNAQISKNKSQDSHCLADPERLEAANALMAVMTALPTPPYFTVRPHGEFRMTVEMFANILGTSPRSVIINDSEELRFIPYTLTGTPLLLVLKSPGHLSPAKVEKLLSVAKLQKISISLVWLDQSPFPASLLKIVQESEGFAWTLADLKNQLNASLCP